MLKRPSGRRKTAVSTRENKLLALLQRLLNLEFIRYLIAGVLTTLVNFVVFTLLRESFGDQHKYLFNILAIELSILFAFFVNRYFVFASRSPLWEQIISFFLTRNLISLIFDNGFLWLIEDIIGFQEKIPLIRLSWAKLIGSILIVLLNYVAGKFITFRDNKGESKS